MPAASQRGGVTIASSTPSVTQLSAESASAAPSPARPPRSIQASANSTGTSSARAGRAPGVSHPSATTASTGTAHSARYVSPCALACSAAPAISTKPSTDSGGIAAQRRPRSRSRLEPAGARGIATSAPWTSDSNPMEIQNGSISAQHRFSGPGGA